MNMGGITELEPLTSSKGAHLLLNFYRLVRTSDPGLPNSSGFSSIIYMKDFYESYSWVPQTINWNKSDSQDKLIFNLPAARGVFTNNARIEFTGVSSGRTDNDYRYELPEQLTGLFYVDNAQVGKLSVIGTEVNGSTYTKTGTVSKI